MSSHASPPRHRAFSARHLCFRFNGAPLLAFEGAKDGSRTFALRKLCHPYFEIAAKAASESWHAIPCFQVCISRVSARSAKERFKVEGSCFRAWNLFVLVKTMEGAVIETQNIAQREKKKKKFRRALAPSYFWSSSLPLLTSLFLFICDVKNCELF